MEAYEQNLHISDTAFDGMRQDADRVLQRLIKNMVEKDSMEGKVTITIDVSLIQEFIPNRDPNIDAETRRILTPKICHKVGSVMQIKNEAKGDKNYDGMELVWDEKKGEYVLRPVANTEQMSIFDAEFRCVNDEDEDTEQPALEGRRIAALPGPADDEAEEVEFKEVTVDETCPEEDEEFGMPKPVIEEDEEFPVPAPSGLPFDDYDYEEPDDDEEDEE